MNASSKLPDGWTQTTFGALVSPVSVQDKKLPRGAYLESGRFPVVDQGKQFIGGYSDDESRVISEDLPLLVFGDHTRAFKYLDQPFVPGADGVKVLKPLGVFPKWLYHIAHILDLPDKGYARHYQHLKSARIIVPPLGEQPRIVAEIEKQFTRVDAGVAALRRVQANLKRYRAAVLKAACEGRLVPTEAELDRAAKRKGTFQTGEALLAHVLAERRRSWTGRGKYREPSAPATINLPLLPEGWAWATFEQIGEATTGVTPPKGNAELFGGHIPFFKPTDLDAGYHVREFRDSLTESGAKHCRLLPERSILVTCIGATIGKTGFARVQCATNQQINALTVPPDLVSPEFVYWYINSPFGQRQICEHASATTLPILNKSKFEALPIPLPPLAEQTRIVAEVERRFVAADELHKAASKSLQRAIRLRSAILVKSFSASAL